MVDKVAIGNRIANARKALGISQSDLAEAIGVSVSFMSKLERGQVSIPLNRLAQIASALKTTIGALVDNIDKSTDNYGFAEMEVLLRDLSSKERDYVIAYTKFHIQYLRSQSKDKK